MSLYAIPASIPFGSPAILPGTGVLTQADSNHAFCIMMEPFVTVRLSGCERRLRDIYLLMGDVSRVELRWQSTSS